MTLETLQLIFPNASNDTWHQHPNGYGWVENTAYVADTAYVGPDAQVSGNALVYGNSRVSGNARVYGNALVSGNAWVSDNARVYGTAEVSGTSLVYGDSWDSSPLQIQGSRHFLNMATKTILRIGCQEHTIQWWLDNGMEVAKAENFTEKEIKEYRDYVQLFSKRYSS